MKGVKICAVTYYATVMTEKDHMTRLDSPFTAPFQGDLAPFQGSVALHFQKQVIDSQFTALGISKIANHSFTMNTFVRSLLRFTTRGENWKPENLGAHTANVNC